MRLLNLLADLVIFLVVSPVFVLWFIYAGVKSVHRKIMHRLEPPEVFVLRQRKKYLNDLKEIPIKKKTLIKV